MGRRLKKYIIIVAILMLGFATQAVIFKNQRVLSPKTIKSFIKPPAATSAPNIELATAKVKVAEKPAPVDGEYHLVLRVVDGDTIEIDSGEKVRYIGMDTPETAHPRKPVQCFGKEASAANKSFVSGQKVRLVKDVSEVDKYGRLLRYVYLEDGTFVNLELVKEGYAQAATFPPDVKYSAAFVAAAREAREAGRGLWSACR